MDGTHLPLAGGSLMNQLKKFFHGLEIIKE